MVPGEWIPHGQSYGWDSLLVWLHVVSDSLTGLACLSMSFTVVYVFYRRRALPWNWTFAAWGVFLCSSGAAHLMEVWNIWNVSYGLAGGIKAAAAAASVIAAVGLMRLVPEALRLPGPGEWERVQQKLADETEQRTRTEKELENVRAEHGTRARERAAELQRANDRFRLAVESAPNAMIMVNRKGEIVLANAQTEILFGYSRDELLGGSIEKLVPGRFRREHDGYRADFLREPQTRPMGAGRDLYGLRKDGTEFPVEIGLNPIHTGDEIFVLSAVVDITERKKAEELVKASLGEKEILLREVHHRVKNNLQVIASLLRMQSDRSVDASVAEMFRESQNRVHSIALIHERLYQSKDLSRIDLNDYAQALCNDLLRSFGTNDVRLHIDVARVDVGIDTANACGLIINELVTNSLRHAFPEGHQGRIDVTINDDASGNGDQDGMRRFTLVVSDDGMGFPSGVDFHHPETLGLQLVSAIVHQLEGSMRLERDHGTRFTIAFKELSYMERI